MDDGSSFPCLTSTKFGDPNLIAQNGLMNLTRLVHQLPLKMRKKRCQIDGLEHHKKCCLTTFLGKFGLKKWRFWGHRFGQIQYPGTDVISSQMGESSRMLGHSAVQSKLRTSTAGSWLSWGKEEKVSLIETWNAIFKKKKGKKWDCWICWFFV